MIVQDRQTGKTIELHGAVSMYDVSVCGPHNIGVVYGWSRLRVAYNAPQQPTTPNPTKGPISDVQAYSEQVSRLRGKDDNHVTDYYARQAALNCREWLEHYSDHYIYDHSTGRGEWRP